MKRQAVAIVGAVLVSASLMSSAARAAAFDSAFAGESAFLTLAPGQSGSLTVFFQNTGTATWVKGTDSQVDLAACRDDQVTCDSQDTAETDFASGWKAATRYATHAQATVAPGAIATFTYSVAVPLTAAARTYRFNGDLVIASNGRAIHPEGYYHDVTVSGSSCGSPVGISASPAFTEIQVGLTVAVALTLTCANSSKAVGATVNAAVRAGTEVAGNPNLDLTATSDANGIATFRWTRSNPGREVITATPFGTQNVTTSATVRWAVPSAVLACTPGDSASLPGGQFRSFTITAKDPTTGAALANTAIDITITTYIPSATATVNGVSAVDRSVGSTITTMTTNASGIITFVVGGRGATVQPRAFIDDNSSDTLDTTEFRGTCGSTSFES